MYILKEVRNFEWLRFTTSFLILRCKVWSVLWLIKLCLETDFSRLLSLVSKSSWKWLDGKVSIRMDHLSLFFTFLINPIFLHSLTTFLYHHLFHWLSYHTWMVASVDICHAPLLPLSRFNNQVLSDHDRRCLGPCYNIIVSRHGWMRRRYLDVAELLWIQTAI